MKVVTLSKQAESIIETHAIETYPEECCGFLFGKEDSERQILIALPVPNSKQGDKRRRFEISPIDYMKAEQYALENDAILLGIYHSHPDHPARPSEHDRKQAVPFFSYIITPVSKNGIQNTTSWQLNENNQFDQEALHIYEDENIENIENN